ncbi:MAG: hypothetical protein LBM87_00705 [Ruminococcus sp.]|nr:hypothetical protein [Ruminococcus sp.]
MTQTTQPKEFFSYKGYPLVRKEDTIYFGSMADNYVVMLQILEKQKVGTLDVATKIKIYEMATDESLPPDKAIIKTSEKNSLYEALDIAHIWLSRAS